MFMAWNGKNPPEGQSATTCPRPPLPRAAPNPWCTNALWKFNSEDATPNYLIASEISEDRKLKHFCVNILGVFIFYLHFWNISLHVFLSSYQELKLRFIPPWWGCTCTALHCRVHWLHSVTEVGWDWRGSRTYGFGPGSSEIRFAHHHIPTCYNPLLCSAQHRLSAPFWLQPILTWRSRLTLTFDPLYCCQKPTKLLIYS